MTDACIEWHKHHRCRTRGTLVHHAVPDGISAPTAGGTAFGWRMTGAASQGTGPCEQLQSHLSEKDNPSLSWAAMSNGGLAE